MSGEGKEQKEKEKYRYDPERFWVNVQEGGTSQEVYVHAYDHEDEAKEAADKTEEDSYNILASDSISRSKLEQSAPHMYTAAKAVLDDMGPHFEKVGIYTVPLAKKLQEALALAEKDEYLRDILEACGVPKTQTPAFELAQQTLDLMCEMITSMSSYAEHSAATDDTRKAMRTLDAEWRWDTIRENLIRMANS